MRSLSFNLENKADKTVPKIFQECELRSKRSDNMRISSRIPIVLLLETMVNISGEAHKYITINTVAIIVFKIN